MRVATTREGREGRGVWGGERVALAGLNWIRFGDLARCLKSTLIMEAQLLAYPGAV